MKKTLILLALAALLALSGCGYLLVEDLPPTSILAPTVSPEATEAPEVP